MFLYIDPLKQGLKRFNIIIASSYLLFLYIDPLKQGLKLIIFVSGSASAIVFLYIDPLKQGLKPCTPSFSSQRTTVFIHRSIKTRIETLFAQIWDIYY